MSYPYPRITKHLSLTPVGRGTSPRAKTSGFASDVENLFKFLYIPPFVATGFTYIRQMLCQFNVAFTEDFYLLNSESYKAFASYIIHGGCICFKYRIGSIVYRYKVIDSDYSTDWSFFIPYSNQLIKKNFVIEFWGNTLGFGQLKHQLVQGLTLQLSSIYEPTSVEEAPATTEVKVTDLLNIAALGVNLPEALPYNQPTIAFTTN